MKVRELIELLEGFDGDKEVMLEMNGGEYISDMENMDIVEHGENEVWLLN